MSWGTCGARDSRAAMSGALHWARWLSPALPCACIAAGEGNPHTAGDFGACDDTPSDAAGNAMALQLTIAAASADFGTAALTFYDSPVVVDPAPALNSTCEVPTQPHEFFLTGKRPSEKAVWKRSK